MQDILYYRRVWQFSGAWKIVAEGYVRAPDQWASVLGLTCSFNGPTYCQPPLPYIFERWWRYTFGTYGTGGSWSFAGEMRNWE
jgi:hypothetical protein